jgi:hypothetical protein
MMAPKDKLAAYRRGVRDGVALGERIGRVEGHIRTIGATGAVDRVGLLLASTPWCAICAKPRKQPSPIRHGANMEDVE